MTYFNLAVVDTDHQTVKFNPPPNFPAIQYVHVCVLYHKIVIFDLESIHKMLDRASTELGGGGHELYRNSLVCADMCVLFMCQYSFLY